MNNTLTLTHDEAKLLLAAVNSFDLARLPLEQVQNNRIIRQQLEDHLRSMCWTFQYEEAEEKRTAKLQIEVACKRWPDILNELKKTPPNLLDPEKFNKLVETEKAKKALNVKKATARLEKWRKELNELEP